MLANQQLSHHDIITEIQEIASALRQKHPPALSMSGDSVTLSVTKIRNLKDTDAVFYLYRTILDRDPDRDGFAQCLKALRKGELTVVGLCETLIKSSAKRRGAINLVHDSNPQNTSTAGTGKKKETDTAFLIPDDFKSETKHEFIKKVYINILGRDPDESGIEAYTNALNNGMALNDVIIDVIQSEEAIKRDRKVYVLGISQPDQLFKAMFEIIERLSATVEQMEYDISKLEHEYQRAEK